MSLNDTWEAKDMKRILTLAASMAVLATGAAQAQPQTETQIRGAAPPAGDYWRTCQSISTYGYGDNAVMSGQCQDNRGRWRQSSLRFARCSEVENRNGQLTCVSSGRPPWGGGGGGGRPPWNDGRPPYGGGSITIYDGPNFRGQPFDANREVTNLPRQYNDRAMSLRIQGRGAWQVCSDSDFRGRCQIFDRDVPDLRQYGLGEAVSSMRPVQNQYQDPYDRPRPY